MSLRRTPTLTPAMLAANRSNAQKSTGPRTEEGRRRVRLNGLKHGSRSRSFRESLIKSGESTTLVDRNFLFLNLCLMPQKRYEVRRIAQFVRVLWSVTRWARRHEVRPASLDLMFNRWQIDLQLEVLLKAAEQRVGELARHRIQSAGLESRTTACQSALLPPQTEAQLHRTGPILLPGLAPPGGRQKDRLVHTRWVKRASKPGISCGISEIHSCNEPLHHQDKEERGEVESADKNEPAKPECRVESDTSILHRSLPSPSATTERNSEAKPPSLGGAVPTSLA